MNKQEKIELLYELLRELFPGKVSRDYWGPDADDCNISLLASVRNNAASPEIEHKEPLWLYPKGQTIEMFPYYEKEDDCFITFSFEKNNF